MGTIFVLYVYLEIIISNIGVCFLKYSYHYLQVRWKKMCVTTTRFYCFGTYITHSEKRPTNNLNLKLPSSVTP